jgi:hypothetical protein
MFKTCVVARMVEIIVIIIVIIVIIIIIRTLRSASTSELGKKVVSPGRDLLLPEIANVESSASSYRHYVITVFVQII